MKNLDLKKSIEERKIYWPWSSNRSICINIFGTAASCRLSFNNCDKYSGLSVKDGSVCVAGGDVLWQNKFFE